MFSYINLNRRDQKGMNIHKLNIWQPENQHKVINMGIIPKTEEALESGVRSKTQIIP
jgi:hypothetical protein